MEDKLPDFLEQREAGQLAKWIKQLFHEWVLEFDLPDVTEDDITEAGGEEEVAKKALRMRARKVSVVLTMDNAYSRWSSASTNGSTTTRPHEDAGE